MSMDNLSIDFSNSLSFDLPSVAHIDNKTIVTPSIKDKKVKRNNRNRQCIPSDDEDEEEVEEQEEEEEEVEEQEEEEDEEEVDKKITFRPIRKSRPLPSDDENSDQDERDNMQFYGHAYQNQYYNHARSLSDEEDEEDDDDDKALMPAHGLTFMEGTHLQQLYQKQQQHQAQLAQFQHYHRSKQHQSNKNMSGMDLLKQLEQEKADAKRTKPKLDTSKVKMKGLLGQLPEPGSHNISFQQIEQQQRMSMMKPKAQYLDPQHLVYPPRSPSPNRQKPQRKL